MAEYLPNYARHFATVEIDRWFWSLFPTGAKLPNPNTVKRYAGSAPNDSSVHCQGPQCHHPEPSLLRNGRNRLKARHSAAGPG